VNEYYYDSCGNKLLDGDIVRMYHFTGARNRKHYMYKRFTGYCKSPTGEIYGTWESLGNKSHNFVEYDNNFKEIIVVVQRAEYRGENLRRSKKWRD